MICWLFHRRYRTRFIGAPHDNFISISCALCELVRLARGPEPAR